MNLSLESFLAPGLAMLNDLGETLFRWVVSMNVWVAALFVVAFFLDRLLASRVAAAWRVLLYVPIVVRLLVPSSWVIVVPVVATPSAASAPAMLIDGPVTTILTASAPLPNASHIVLSWVTLLPAAYLIGIVILTGRWFRDRRAMQKILRDSSTAPAWLRGLGRSFDILEHASAGPLLIGTRSPRLVVPAGLCERIGERGVRAVVAHEASHVHRRDPLLAAFLHATVILAWPVVAIWCAVARVRALIEIACDERALAGADAELRRSYGEALIELASPHRRPVAALGFGDALHERIASLRLATHRWSTLRQVSVMALACVAIAACSTTRVETMEVQFETNEFTPDLAIQSDVYYVPHLQEQSDVEFTPDVQSRSEVKYTPDAQSRSEVKYTPRSEVVPYSVDWIFRRGTFGATPNEPIVLRTSELKSRFEGSSRGSLLHGSWDFSNSESKAQGFGQPGPKGRMHSVNPRVIAADGDVVTLSLAYGRRSLTKQEPAQELTLSLRRGQSVEIALDQESKDTLILTARRNDEVVEELRFLSDLPLVGSPKYELQREVQTEEASYPQIFCMMNIIEADGALYFSKDHVIEQGRDDGPGHRVQSGDLTDKTFDWFRRLKGYVNLSAPALITLPGQPGRIAVGEVDKAGELVNGTDITVEFTEVDGTLQADLQWKVVAPDGELVVAYEASDVVVEENGAILAILPSVPEKPGVGRILMVRPSIIRSANEAPRQRGN